MSLAGTLMTPRIDSRIRHKLLYGKRKHIDFKDILRERFVNRIKDNRRTLLDKIRSGKSSDGVQDSLQEYLSFEMDQFRQYIKQNSSARFGSPSEAKDYYDQELEEMNALREQVLEEQLSWIMDEYRKEEEQIEAMMTESLACPICKRGILQKKLTHDPIMCTLCNLSLPFSTSIEQLATSLRQNFDEHSVACLSNPQFVSIKENDSNNLFMICPTCSLFKALN